MPVPKKRHSRSRQGKRRNANWKLELPTLVKCVNCGAPVPPHHACTECGFYRGRAVIAIKKDKKESKAQKEKK
ncbi:MAG: 50S ribosomal protein L32 [Candidatus Saganbacteria bacterium]|nr:50S ribosomal protein L32 [Candidatus Saganbacteria bacterium]